MKIYDCFPFFNELDTAEIRFAELYDTVDCFVVVEADQTHSGKPKPLYFQENISRFEPYRDKIRHIVVENMPTDDDHWIRERFQRDQIARVFGHCSGDDLIIISDCDEVPRAEVIKNVNIGHSQVACLVQKAYQYYYNLLGRCTWAMGKVVRYSTFKEFKCASDIRNTGSAVNIGNAGWHFGYMGGLDKVSQKLQAFAHQEFNMPELMNLRHLRANINSGFQPWDRNMVAEPSGDPYWKFITVDENADLPKHLIVNKDRFRIADVKFTKYPYDGGGLKRMGALALSVLDKQGKIISVGNGEGQATIHLANIVHPEQVFAFDAEPNTNFAKNVLALTEGNVEFGIADTLALLNNVGGTIKFLHLMVAENDLGPMIDAVRTKLHGVLCGYGYNDAVKNVLCERFSNWEVSGELWHITFTL